LRKLYTTHRNPDWRLRALWTLHVTGGLTAADLEQALESKDEYIRAWSIQLLCEDFAPSSIALRRFVAMAYEDRSPVVRLYLASALPRVPADAAWQITEGLLTHGEDATDHNLPRMIWFGLEPLVGKDPGRGLALVAGSRIPLIAEYTARRSVDADALPVLLAALEKRPATLESMLRGMRDGLEGRNDLTTPDGWAALHKQLQSLG